MPKLNNPYPQQDENEKWYKEWVAEYGAWLELQRQVNDRLRPSQAIDFELDVLDHSASLDDYKQQAKNAVDSRTRDLLISFGHGGKTFSLSRNAQQNYTDLMVAVNSGAKSTPTTVTAIDGTTLPLADAAAVKAFFVAFLGAKETPLKSGAVLKVLIDAAADHDAVDAVVDTR